MQGKYMLMDARDAAAVKQLSRAITGWDPLLAVKYTSSESLYDGVATCYGLAIGDPATLTFRGHTQAVSRADAIVMPPAVRVASNPRSEFLWVAYEGLAPDHLRGPAGLETGFEHFSFDETVQQESPIGRRRAVISPSDLRYRAHYYFVHVEQSAACSTAETTELCYVLGGDGEMRIGPTEEAAERVTLQAGQLVAIGPGLIYVPAEGLRLCIWSLLHEPAHRRRVREAAGK